MGFRHWAYRPKIAGTDKRYPNYAIKFFKDKKFLFQEKTDYTDKRAAEDLGRKKVQQMEYDAHLEAIGVPKLSDRPLRELADEYIADGKDSRGLRQNPWSTKYLRIVEYGFAWWLATTGWTRLADMNLHGAKAALREKKNPRTGAPATGHGKNNTMAILQGFITFCWENKYLPRSVNPLEGFRPYPDDPEPTRVSRDYKLSEFRALCLEATLPERIAYLVAASTAIRFTPLQSRLVADADFNGARIRIHRRKNKSRKEVWKQVPRWIMDMVESEVKRLDLGPTDPLLPGLQAHHAGKTIQQQLRRAGVAIETPEGRLTFHGLKVHFVNLLWELGTDSKTVQDMAEHSTLNLSTKTYGREKEARQREVAEGVGERLRLALGDPETEIHKGVTGDEEEGREHAEDTMKSGAEVVGAAGFEPAPAGATNIGKPRPSWDIPNAGDWKGAGRAEDGSRTPPGHAGPGKKSQGSNKQEQDMGQIWGLLTPEMRQSVLNHARACLMGILPNKHRKAG